MNKLKLFLCLIGLHKYKKFEENSTVYRCKNCEKFKFGEAIDKDGLKMFVFEDGSCLKQWRDKV